MKISKSELKKMILEELENFEEQAAVGEPKMKSSEVGKLATQQRDALRAGGIDEKERAAIATVSQKLAVAAKSGNILSGSLLAKLKMLIAEIDKVLSTKQ